MLPTTAGSAPVPENRKPPINILLAAPRGFCAGVRRAIEAVEDALITHGAPVYVRRPIVHNLAVVRALEAKGAIFIEELEQAPEGSVVIFSAHGVAPRVWVEAQDRRLQVYDAVCPLVAKVHREVERHHRNGRKIVLIGHEGHPEIEGTLGRLSPGSAFLVRSVPEVHELPLASDAPAAYAVQTTYSVDDARTIVEALRARFSDLEEPATSDICYATTNRQGAVRTLAQSSDAIIVVGEAFSSNARRLAEVAADGCTLVQLVADSSELNWSLLPASGAIGITAAASTPESSVREVLDALASRFDLQVAALEARPETAVFKRVAVA
jgi:4-hydroxy-3-methylbut-2-en-1-yl diphosphate reductase